MGGPRTSPSFDKKQCNKCGGDMLSKAKWRPNQWIDQPKMVQNKRVEWAQKALEPKNSWIFTLEKFAVKDIMRELKEKYDADDESKITSSVSRYADGGTFICSSTMIWRTVLLYTVHDIGQAIFVLDPLVHIVPLSYDRNRHKDEKEAHSDGQPLSTDSCKNIRGTNEDTPPKHQTNFLFGNNSILLLHFLPPSLYDSLYVRYGLVESGRLGVQL